MSYIKTYIFTKSFNLFVKWLWAQKTTDSLASPRFPLPNAHKKKCTEKKNEANSFSIQQQKQRGEREEGSRINKKKWKIMEDGKSKEKEEEPEEAKEQETKSEKAKEMKDEEGKAAAEEDLSFMKQMAHERFDGHINDLRPFINHVMLSHVDEASRDKSINDKGSTTTTKKKRTAKKVSSYTYSRKEGKILSKCFFVAYFCAPAYPYMHTHHSYRTRWHHLNIHTYRHTWIFAKRSIHKYYETNTYVYRSSHPLLRSGEWVIRKRVWSVWLKSTEGQRANRSTQA